MPIPEAGNGTLGTIDDETEVAVIAKKGGFVFFVAYDGQMGWNGDGFFRKITTSGTTPREDPPSSTYSYRDLVNKVTAYDQFVGAFFPRKILCLPSPLHANNSHVVQEGCI
jgi:hypothetical protein